MDKLHLDQHISRQFNEDLEGIRAHMLEMGGLVEKQVADAIQALEDANSSQAVEVCQLEKRVNDLELSIDEECTMILARRQPAASDLRMVLAVSKTIRDLERIGDESAKIAKLAIKLTEEGGSPHGYMEIRHIGNKVRKMVNDALDAFARYDLELALSVAASDKEVDREYSSAVREIVTYMMEDPRSITRVMSVMWALRALERIGDHAGNIAEHLIYLVKGKDVRHTSLDDLERWLHK